jgi:hypothetical protein
MRDANRGVAEDLCVSFNIAPETRINSRNRLGTNQRQIFPSGEFCKCFVDRAAWSRSRFPLATPLATRMVHGLSALQTLFFHKPTTIFTALPYHQRLME